MKQYAIDLIKRINELCKLYSNYLSVYSDGKLNVFIQDNLINLKLYNGIELVDEFEISFGESEKDIYVCLSVTILNLLYGNIRLFNGQNRIYNRMDNSNICMFVYDDNVLDAIMSVIVSNDSDKVYNDICNRLVWRIYPRKIIKHLDERINLSRKLIRLDGNV